MLLEAKINAMLPRAQVRIPTGIRVTTQIHGGILWDSGLTQMLTL